MQGPAEIDAVSRGRGRLHRTEVTGEHTEVSFACWFPGDA
jgi:hypothetical protein